MNKKSSYISLVLISLFLLWYLLPIARYYFSSSVVNIFMAFLLVIWLFIILLKIRTRRKLIPLYLFFVFGIIGIYFFNILYRNDVGNIFDFIKMGIMYWFPCFIFISYFSLNEKKSMKFLLRLFLFCFIITAIPTIIELLKDSSSIRWMAYYSNQKLDMYLIKGKSNIGDYSFIYSLVFCVPIFYYKFKKSERNKKIYLVLLIMAIILVFKASFSSAIVLLLFSILFCFYNMSINGNSLFKSIAIIFFILTTAIILFCPNILLSISQNIKNEFISSRIKEIANVFISTNNMDGDLFSRVKLYKLSFTTFLKHPFLGSGGYYYVENVGVGYHSQLLDDMARYGIMSLLFTIFFLLSYYKFLIRKTDNSNELKSLIRIEIVLYFILSLINPIYQCAWISTVFLLVLPIVVIVEGGINEKNI